MAIFMRKSQYAFGLKRRTKSSIQGTWISCCTCCIDTIVRTTVKVPVLSRWGYTPWAHCRLRLPTCSSTEGSSRPWLDCSPRCGAIAFFLGPPYLFQEIPNELFHDTGPVDKTDQQNISMEMDKGMWAGPNVPIPLWPSSRASTVPSLKHVSGT